MFVIIYIILCTSGTLSESSVIDNQELYDNYPEHRNIRSSEANCVYTFNVPKTDVNTCPPGASEISRENLSELKDFILGEFAELRSLIDNSSQSRAHKEAAESRNVDIGAHYTRWGSTLCPETAELIYHGFAAKSHYNHNGGGINYLCLPQDPEFDDQHGRTGFQSHSYIYGVEYERNGSPLMPSNKQDNDAPCAVCHVTGRVEQLMIPAKKSCPAGWTLEYKGVIMSQHHSHKSSEFVCVDRSMEVLSGGRGSVDGGLFLVVEAHCGALKCPPYADGKEILCVVCTK